MIHQLEVELLPKIRELDIKGRQDVLSRTLTGNWVSSFKGRGMEFEDYRQYLPTDDATFIDWRASLRARKLLIKEFVQDRNLNVLILLDVSNSMLFGTTDKLKAEYVAELVSSVSYASLRAGDAVGLALFTDKIETMISPNIGMSQHRSMLHILSDKTHYGGSYSLSKALIELVNTTNRRSVLIIISDFIGEEGWAGNLRIASQKFDIMGFVVRDPRDRMLPKHAGEYVLEDPYSEQKLIIDCSQYWKAYKEHVEQEEAALQKIFQSARGDSLLLQTDWEYTKPLVTFFKRRLRRSLD